jgi:hypothetical protein
MGGKVLRQDAKLYATRSTVLLPCSTRAVRRGVFNPATIRSRPTREDGSPKPFHQSSGGKASPASLNTRCSMISTSPYLSNAAGGIGAEFPPIDALLVLPSAWRDAARPRLGSSRWGAPTFHTPCCSHLCCRFMLPCHCSRHCEIRPWCHNEPITSGPLSMASIVVHPLGSPPGLLKPLTPRWRLRLTWIMCPLARS